MHVVLYTFCFLYEQHVINKTEAILDEYIEQRLHKLNQGCYKNDKRSYFPFTSVTHSLSEHHVFRGKLSNKISYSQNIASGTKRVVRISLWKNHLQHSYS